MIFATDPETSIRIHRRCVTSGDIELFRSPEFRPSAADIIRLVNSFYPELALVEVYDRSDATKMVEVVRQACPNLAIVGISDKWRDEPLIETGRGPLRIIASNLPLEQFHEAILGVLNS